jgi:lysozyme
MERSLKLFSDGRVVELEDDQPIRLIETNGQVERLFDILLFTSAKTFAIAADDDNDDDEAGKPRGGSGSMRKTNRAGVELIKHFESCKLTAYQDSVGVWTIGYGHTGDVSPGTQITQAQADQLLQDDLARFESAVVDAVTVAIDDNQFGALVSFSFNLGARSLQRSTLLKLLLQGDVQGAADQFLVWNRAGGQVLRGLTRRRSAEQALFLSQDWKAFTGAQEITVKILKLTDPKIQGEDVRQVQAALIKAGFSIGADGVFGNNTDRAVRDFQQQNGLTADGIVGEGTRKKLGL